MSEKQEHPIFGWVPTAPLPMYEWGWFGLSKRYRCGCGEAFKAEAEYERHWGIVHSLDGEANDV